MTSQWDTFGSAFNQLTETKNKGRQYDILEAIRELINTLHDMDHATDHKSTNEIFKSKLMQKHLKILDCKHYEDATLFGEVLDKKEAERGLRVCYRCGITMHKDVIKERYGLDVK